MTKKPLIILLTGPSGAGKTTSILPTFERHGIPAVSTGDFGKELISLIMGSYEQWKHGHSEAGDRACVFFDSLRYLDPHFWVKVTVARIQNKPLDSRLYPAAQTFIKSMWVPKSDVYVSEAVNETELIAWRASWPNLLVIGLEPENPKIRSGDNRTPLPDHLIDLKLQYRLEDSIEATEKLITKYLPYWTIYRDTN